MNNIIGFGIRAQKYLPDAISDAFTTKICTQIGRSRKYENKLRFAKTYKIKWEDATKCAGSNSLESCVKKFTTLNDLFAREIKSELTKPDSTAAQAIVSPAECYARKISASRSFDIKGAKYTLAQLLQRTEVPEKSTVFIFRLAPEQYHRIHSPTASKITDITSVGGTYKSVNPILLNDIPVLQQNFRRIIDFENGLIMIAVGATCVGSIDLTVKPGSKVKHGDDMGAFGFGGSCIVLVVPYKLSDLNKKLSTNEKLLRPGEFVGTIRQQGSSPI